MPKKKKLQKNRNSYLNPIIFAGFAAIVGLTTLNFSRAATDDATVSLSPGSAAIQKDQSFSVTAGINTGTNSAKQIWVNLFFNSEELEFTGFTRAANSFPDCSSVQVLGPDEVTLTCWDDNTSHSGSQAVGTVTFKGLKAASSYVYADHSSGGVDDTDYGFGSSNGPQVTYTITDPSQATPPSSTTPPATTTTSKPPVSTSKPQSTTTTTPTIAKETSTPTAQPEGTKKDVPNQTKIFSSTQTNTDNRVFYGIVAAILFTLAIGGYLLWTKRTLLKLPFLTR